MNLSDTARLRTLTLQRAVVYDGDAERAERVADVLRTWASSLCSSITAR